jgi:thymidylate synthase
VTAWNPAEISETALPPCHWAFEVIVSPLTTQQKINYSGKDPVYLETVWNSAVVKKDAEAQELLKQELAHVPEYGFQLKWHQRSCDLFLGIPFNIASYGLLAYILGDLTGLVPLAVIADLSHIHIYAPHMKSVEEQLSRNPMQYESPTLTFSPNYLKASAEFKSSLGLSDHFNEFVNKLSHEDFIFNNYQHFPQLKEDMFAEEN